jgi:hypothetical protein
LNVDRSILRIIQTVQGYYAYRSTTKNKVATLCVVNSLVVECMQYVKSLWPQVYKNNNQNRPNVFLLKKEKKRSECLCRFGQLLLLVGKERDMSYTGLFTVTGTQGYYKYVLHKRRPVPLITVRRRVS